jgi:hypothetical protein
MGYHIPWWDGYILERPITRPFTRYPSLSRSRLYINTPPFLSSPLIDDPNPLPHGSPTYFRTSDIPGIMQSPTEKRAEFDNTTRRAGGSARLAPPPRDRLQRSSRHATPPRCPRRPRIFNQQWCRSPPAPTTAGIALGNEPYSLCCVHFFPRTRHERGRQPAHARDQTRHHRRKATTRKPRRLWRRRTPPATTTPAGFPGYSAARHLSISTRTATPIDSNPRAITRRIDSRSAIGRLHTPHAASA